MRPPRFRFLFLLVPLLACFLCGCTDRIQDGTTTIYRFSLWVPLVTLSACLLALPVGYFLRRTSVRIAVVILVLAPILLIIVVPGLFLDRVTVNEDHFTLKTGFWFMPTRHDVSFKNLQRIVLEEETSGGRRRSTSYYLDCYPTSGSRMRVPIGNLMQNAVPEILAVARKQNIPVVDNLK